MASPLRSWGFRVSFSPEEVLEEGEQEQEQEQEEGLGTAVDGALEVLEASEDPR